MTEPAPPWTVKFKCGNID